MDWIRIKNEYINTDTSYRKLAEKYGVSVRTLANRAKNEKWVELKKKQCDKIDTKMSQKTAEKIVSAQTRRLEKILKLSDALIDKIAEAADQLEKEYKNGEAVNTGMVNTARLRQIVQSLKDIREMQTADSTTEDNTNVVVNITGADKNAD